MPSVLSPSVNRLFLLHIFYLFALTTALADDVLMDLLYCHSKESTRKYYGKITDVGISAYYCTKSYATLIIQGTYSVDDV